MKSNIPSVLYLQIRFTTKYGVSGNAVIRHKSDVRWFRKFYFADTLMIALFSHYILEKNHSN